MLPSVSAIVPAKNEEKVIENCIKSLLNSNYPKDKLEIIVSIDGSTDKTLEICKKYEPRIKVIESKPKKCKAEALNEVLHIANGEIVAIYDADCIVDKNCLKKAVKHFSDKKIAAVAGTIRSYNKNKSLVARAISLETSFTSFIEYFLSSLGANTHFLGKNIFIRKKILEKISGFDTFTFIEDIEMSIRMKKYNYKTVFEPHAITWQEEPISIKSFLKQRLRWARGTVRLIKFKRRRGLRNILSDGMHGIYFYFPPFGLITATILAIVFYLQLPYIIVLPFLGLFIFNMILLIYSRIFFKESLRDLLALPVWFILSNIHLFLIIKSWIDENKNKEFMWYRVER
ncbi:MAG: glycosyltransferase [Candidatus Aenigmarchaeota archaeon]|nr:glycosyltransferase [Candidatus Aenigmarchaeota archaeon]